MHYGYYHGMLDCVGLPVCSLTTADSDSYVKGEGDTVCCTHASRGPRRHFNRISLRGASCHLVIVTDTNAHIHIPKSWTDMIVVDSWGLGVGQFLAAAERCVCVCV